MSTPPPLPDDTLELSPRPPKRSLLAKLTIALAVILGLTFGLCTAAVASGATINEGIVFETSITIEAACVLGLFVIAIIVIFRALRGDY